MREYYANVGKALLRGHAMTQLAYMLLALNRGTRGSYSQEAEVERHFFLEQYDKFQQVIDDLVKKSSRDLWKCNPNPHNDRRKWAAARRTVHGELMFLLCPQATITRRLRTSCKATSTTRSISMQTKVAAERVQTAGRPKTTTATVTRCARTRISSEPNARATYSIVTSSIRMARRA